MPSYLKNLSGCATQLVSGHGKRQKFRVRNSISISIATIKPLRTHRAQDKTSTDYEHKQEVI